MVEFNLLTTKEDNSILISNIKIIIILQRYPYLYNGGIYNNKSAIAILKEIININY